MLLHLISEILDGHLLRHRIRLLKLVLIHSLHCHLLLHKRDLRLLRVEELLLLLGLALTSVIYSFQLTSAVSFVSLLYGMSANEPAFVIGDAPCLDLSQICSSRMKLLCRKFGSDYTRV